MTDTLVGRSILAEWLATDTATGVPRMSRVLDAMVEVEKARIAEVIAAGALPNFKQLRSYGFSEMPEVVVVDRGEMVAIHYPTGQWSLDDATTAGDEGSVVRINARVRIAVMVGHRAEGMPLLGARSADIPQLWLALYRANGKLWRTDGGELLQNEISLTAPTFGVIPLPDEPVGWAFDALVNLEFNMRTWIYG